MICDWRWWMIEFLCLCRLICRATWLLETPLCDELAALRPSHSCLLARKLLDLSLTLISTADCTLPTASASPSPNPRRPRWSSCRRQSSRPLMTLAARAPRPRRRRRHHQVHLRYLHLPRTPWSRPSSRRALKRLSPTSPLWSSSSRKV